MLIDARSLPQDHVVHADVCIVGAGPAGLTLARELANGPLRLALLDSGAADPEKTTGDVRTQVQGTTSGDAYAPLDIIRAQGLGGTMAIWVNRLLNLGVRLRPLEVADFERRDWVPNSGWPFGRDELDPFYLRAQDAFGVGRFVENVSTDSPDARDHPLVVGELMAEEFRFAQQGRLLGVSRPVLEQARNVDTYLNATVVELDCAENENVIRRVHVRTAPGHRLTVEARWFVLATGGVENVRTLLLSNRTHTAGIGNQHDLVGRYFADHPHVIDATLVLSDPTIMRRLAAYDTTVADGVGIMRAITLDPAVIEREQLLHTWTLLHPKVSARYAAALSSVRDVVSAARSPARLPTLPRVAARNAGTLFRGIDPMVRALATGTRSRRIPIGWASRRPADSLFAPGELALCTATEQAPNPDSRVTLGSGVDRLGLRQAHLDYRWSDIDVQTVRRTMELIDKELAAAGIGTIRIEESEHGYPDLTKVTCAHHPLGTTRMHRDPLHGVVDENCRVHGISNLSIAGSSVFPTGGSANPTLTLVALAIRLADHLKRALA